MASGTLTHRTARSFVSAMALALVAVIAPVAQAQSDGLVARYDRQINAEIPTVLSSKQREFYVELFAAIDRQKWDKVEDMLDRREGDILHQVAAAEFYTHANSPKVSAKQISEWFEDGVHLPHSEQLGRLGEKRGLDRVPELPRAQSFQWKPAAPKRIRPKTVQDGSMSSSTRSAILNRIRNDDPAGAHELLYEVDHRLSPEARAEWRQRVAWSYYIENNDEAALAVAETARQGNGAWVGEGEWVAGLAAWRLGYCALAGEAFQRAAAQSTNQELTAAAHYWAHRSLVRCREPGEAQNQLSAAARYSETLYGMLASEQLGIYLPPEAEAVPFTKDDWSAIGDVYNVRIAKALVEIGRPGLADEVLRHQARVGDPQDYPHISRLARSLGLPSTQLFLAHNAPYGMQPDTALRYPIANWQPKTGWRVDPALAFAHALQESNFRAGAVSPANARGLMQIMPGTARDWSGRLNLGASYADLNDPEVNLTYGQRHLEMLRDNAATGGQLPKIMAAYNAGLTPVSRWNYEIRDFNDPLLYMESIPYWETRGYVAIVMRNYWMYERAAGVASPSRRALAQGRWPEFPHHAITHTAQLKVEN